MRIGLLREQNSNKCKKIEYKELVCLYLKEEVFNCVGYNLYNSIEYYANYARHSTADTDGYWHCIVLKNIASGEKLIIYTGGRLRPLYVAYEGRTSQ